MSLLIDGYNLLHISGILGRGVGPGGLHGARLAMLNFLAESLDPADLPRTIVVFDSNDAPWGLPQRMTHRGIAVRFAAKYPSADEMLEELIRADSTPRRLVVVSSDHRIQRAARRRRAKAVDSDVWYRELLRLRQSQRENATLATAKPAAPLLTEDVEYWLRQFGGESELTAFLRQEAGDARAEDRSAAPSPLPSIEETSSTDDASKKGQTRKYSARVWPPAAESDKPTSGGWVNGDDPFPPGYGEDLLRNEDLLRDDERKGKS
jgi:uncharacterized protein